MLDIQFPPNSYIVEFLWSEYGIEVKSATSISGGADMNAASYKVQTPDQKSYFVKVKHGYEPDDNILELLAELHAHGLEEIISPLAAVCNCLVVPVIDHSLSVYPFIEGPNGFNQKLTKKQWITLGKALKQIHNFDVPSDIHQNLNQETYSPKWRKKVRALLEKIEKQKCKDTFALKFLNFLKQHKSDIEQLVNRAEELANIIKRQPKKFVLCHSDIHAGNILIDKNNSIYIVDWDEAIMAPKERDLMFIGAGVGNVWNDPQEEMYFYEGYGNTAINKQILTYYRCERIVQDIAEYAQFFLEGTNTTSKDQLEMYQHFVSMFEPNGVVEITLKTDKENN